MTEAAGSAECGAVFVQNITAADGARVNAVQHGDQYNYIYRGAPPYRVEPFPFPTDAEVPEALARVPSRLLAARHQVVPFFLRPELNLLESWRDESARGLSVRLVHAEGGTGKTRLAQEFAARSIAAGWTVALARHRSEVASAGGGDESLTVRSPGLVLIVDYAERWPPADLITLVRQHRDAARDRLRLLLLARPAGAWWQSLAYQLTKLGEFDMAAIRLAELADTPGTRTAVYTAARDRFAEIFAFPGADSLGVPACLSDAEFALTLTVHMRALIDVDAACSGHDPPTGGSQANLSSYLLDREYDYWRSSHNNGCGPVQTAESEMGRAVYVAVLTRSLTSAHAAAALIRSTAASTPAEAERVVADHSFCYPPADDALVLDPLAPDRLGEDYLALSVPGLEDVFGYYATDQWTVTAPALLLEPDDAHGPAAYTRQAISTLIEAAHRWPHLIERHIAPLLRAHPDLAVAAGSAALSRLADLPTLELDVLEAIDLLLPDRPHVDLDLGSAATFARLAEHRLAAAADAASRAATLAKLAWRQGNAGLHEQALHAATRTVDAYRALSEADPETYLPHLAVALGNLGGRLALTGRRADAVEPAQEAVDLYSELLRRWPDVYVPELAAALNMLGNRLSEVGRLAEALEPTREAVQLRRQQVLDEPEAYRPRLAPALTNLGIRFAQLGHTSEALNAARESVDLYRELVQVEPTEYLPGFALALNSLASRLSRAGLHEEALDRALEAVHHRRELMSANPGANQRNLAVELNNLGVHFAQLDRHEEAVAAIEEAVDLYLALDRRNPAAYRPELAAALGNLGARLSRLHRDVEAHTATERAADLYRALALADPAAHRPGLADTLTVLAKTLERLGRDHDALGSAQEAVEIHRTLAETGPPSRVVGLVNGLGMLGAQLSVMDRDDEAIEAAEECVALNRKLVAGMTEVPLSGLAKALDRLATVLVFAGRDAEALNPINEAIELYRELAARRPARYARLVESARATRAKIR